MTEGGGPRFSLPVGEGVGAMLCLAAGDVVGGASAQGYSATTQQAIVVAYHLIRHGNVEREVLAEEMSELDGDHEAPSVFRSPSPQLREWLDSYRAGEPVYATETSLDPAVRVVPVGMWYRRRPGELVEAALETARLTHLDGSTAVIAAACAAAVAAGCFAQNGRDMLMAVADVATQAADSIRLEEFRFSRIDQMEDVTDRLGRAGSMVGRDVATLVARLGDDPIGLAGAGIALAARADGDPARTIAQAAEAGGSQLAALVGAVVGARVGVRVWPWSIPNDTWFVAMGRRLIAGSRDLADLPVPFAVEQRLTYTNDHRI